MQPVSLLFFFFLFSGIAISGTASTTEDDIAALLALKSGLIDPLNALSNWESPANPQGSTVHCNWTGVTCNSDGFVQKLQLSNLNLSGAVAGEIVRLGSLTTLNISSNAFSSSLSKSLLCLSSLAAFDVSELKEWKHVVQEIVRFLKADSPFMNMKPLRYSFIFDTHPDSLPAVSCNYTKRGLVLRDIILSSYHQNEVKFTELTLDTYRMLQCLEWEPSGSFSTRSGADGGHAASGTNRVNLLQDIRDQSLPPNPRKLIMYRPSVTHFLVVRLPISHYSELVLVSHLMNLVVFAFICCYLCLCYTAQTTN